MPWLVPHFATEEGHIILTFQAFVVEAGGRRIMVDTCNGNHKDRPDSPIHQLNLPFLEDLGAAGYPAETIDTVLCTHLHVDHVGWNTRLVDGEWVPTFPNARYLFSGKEWDYWSTGTHELQFGDYLADSVHPIVQAGLNDLVPMDHRITDEVWLEPTAGHTPGHVSVRISSGGHQAVITGDMVHNPYQCAHPDTSTPFCIDPAQARATRRSSFADWYANNVLVIGSHFGGPTSGRLRPEGDGYLLVTE